MVKLLAPISVGDLVDRIIILDLKMKANPKLQYKDELSLLWVVARDLSIHFGSMQCAALQQVNQQLWDAENEIRKTKDIVDTGHIAREIIKLNDERSRIKRRINRKYESEFIEEKVYS